MLKMVRVELIHRHHTSRDKSYMAPPPCLGIDSHQKHTEPEAMSTVGGLIEHKAVESEAHSNKLLRRKTLTHFESSMADAALKEEIEARFQNDFFTTRSRQEHP